MNRTVAVIGGLGLAAAVLLQGCTVPGQQVDDSHLDYPQQPQESAPQYDVQPITPGLIRTIDHPVDHPVRENPSLKTAMTDYQYRVGPQDVLTFTVWDHPELTIPAGEYRSADIQGHLVNAAGNIFFPYVGEIAVAGKTLGEIRTEVTARLAKYIRDPQLDVRVAAFRSKKVNVTGEVKTPGFFPITDIPMTLVDAVNLAGGVTPTGTLQTVELVRDGSVTIHNVQALLERGDLAQNTLLRDGDVVYIPDNSYYVVHALGALVQPGAVPMAKGHLNLAEAISLSGGFDEKEADASRVFVFRNGPDEPEVYWLDAHSPDAMLLAAQFDMQPQDVVYVAPTGLARFNRVISLMLPTVQTLWQTQNLIQRSK